MLDVAGRLATARVRGRWRAPPTARAIDLRTDDGVRLSAWSFDVAAPRDTRGTVVLGHGYRDDRRQLATLAAPLGALGLRTIAFDFRAHGESDGEWITIGHDEARDVAAALAHARALGVPTAYVGFSMGAAAYLLHVLAGGAEADVAVLDAPYDPLRAAIGARLDRYRVPRTLAAGIERLRPDRRFPPVDAARPIEAVALLRRPTLLLFTAHDPWLPAATRGRFAGAMSDACRLEVLAAGGHDDHVRPGTPGEPAWRARVLGHLAAHFDPPPGTPTSAPTSTTEDVDSTRPAG
ncbi:MAG: hypothetical protein NVSMB47_22570 [Polyangiales bacterium]